MPGSAMVVSVIHALKTWPEFYQAIDAGKKTFEIRKDDRGYNVGDVLVLREYDPIKDTYSGRVEMKRVTYITQFGMADGFVCMGFQTFVPRSFAELREVDTACL